MLKIESDPLLCLFLTAGCPDEEEMALLDPDLRVRTRHELTYVHLSSKYYQTDWAFEVSVCSRLK